MPLNSLCAAHPKKITYVIIRIKIALESQKTNKIHFQASQRDHTQMTNMKGRIKRENKTPFCHIRDIRRSIMDRIESVKSIISLIIKVQVQIVNCL